MSGRDDLLAKCFNLAPGAALKLTVAAVEKALPADERPSEWTAVAELFGLLAEDPNLRIDCDSRPGVLTVMRMARAIDRPWFAPAAPNTQPEPPRARRLR